jgi:hypothetical protein
MGCGAMIRWKLKKILFEYHASRFACPTTSFVRLDVADFANLDRGSVMILEAPPSIGEVKSAIWDCGSSKAPGPDGFSFGFVKKYWAKLHSDIMDFVDLFFKERKIPRGCNTSFITLIPKVDNPFLISDYRPISLINVQYKIIAKILANRLALVVDKLVNPVQSAFIGGRQILDGPLILNEVIRWYKVKKKKLMIFKVDFAKAYDSLNWSYLLWVLREMGFGDKWVEMVNACLSSATSSVLINGSPTKEFPIERGLRQGDPLSPFLFILAMEGLHLLINKELGGGNFCPAKIGSKEIKISHLFYADDVIFVAEWSKENFLCIQRILNIFSNASGLRINNGKSNLFGIGVTADEIERLSRASGCNVGMLPFRYLGVPVGERLSSVKAWEPIILKFKSRLARWKANLLSCGGRLTLVSSVLGSLPNYFLSIFRLPKKVNLILEGIRSRFFWGGDIDSKHIHWIKWNVVVSDKCKGGLGIGSIDALNRALLLKWKWRFLSDKKQLWVSVIDSVYGDRVFDPGISSLGGGIWVAICKSNEDLHDKNIIPGDVFKKRWEGAMALGFGWTTGLVSLLFRLFFLGCLPWRMTSLVGLVIVFWETSFCGIGGETLEAGSKNFNLINFVWFFLRLRLGVIVILGGGF